MNIELQDVGAVCKRFLVRKQGMFGPDKPAAPVSDVQHDAVTAKYFCGGGALGGRATGSAGARSAVVTGAASGSRDEDEG